MMWRRAVMSMKFRSLGYCCVQGLKNIGRNRIFSLASIATMALCIFILGLFYSITANVSYMVEQLSESLCVKVFFEEGISDERIESIGNTIEDCKGVSYIHFTSADEAWENYKEEYFGEDYMELAAGYEDDNPLKNSASYEVYITDSDSQESVVKAIKNIDGVRKVNSSDVTADSLTEISSLVRIVSLIVLIILLAITLFLISNTISVGITVRNEEITVMRLLGAHNTFIRAPFVVEGIIIGLAGTVLPIIGLYFGYGNLVEFIIGKYSFLSSILTFMPITNVFRVFIPIAVVLGVGLGFIGSMISLSRHLKK